jgi:hypothetical protein
LEFSSAQLLALQGRKRHLKEPVLAHKHDVIVRLRIKLGRRVDWPNGIPTRMEPSTNGRQRSRRDTPDRTDSHLYDSMHNGMPRTISGSSRFLSSISSRALKQSSTGHVRLCQRSKREHRLEETRRALGRVSDARIVHVDVKVAHEDDDGVAVAHVRDLVPPVREPVLERGVGRAGFEAALELCCERGGEEGLCAGLGAGVLGVGQVGFGGLEVFGDGRGERGHGEVRQGGLEAEHGRGREVLDVAVWERVWVRGRGLDGAGLGHLVYELEARTSAGPGSVRGTYRGTRGPRSEMPEHATGSSQSCRARRM